MEVGTVSMNKKEMGLAVRALVQYASDCFENGDYIEMNEAFKIALNMANMYELREAEWIYNISCVYFNEAMEELKHEIEEGERAQDILNELKKQ